jgi:hypothetical protein
MLRDSTYGPSLLPTITQPLHVRKLRDRSAPRGKAGRKAGIAQRPSNPFPVNV